jgi:hypothetical protein
MLVLRVAARGGAEAMVGKLTGLTAAEVGSFIEVETSIGVSTGVGAFTEVGAFLGIGVWQMQSSV